MLIPTTLPPRALDSPVFTYEPPPAPDSPSESFYLSPLSWLGLQTPAPSAPPFWTSEFLVARPDDGQTSGESWLTMGIDDWSYQGWSGKEEGGGTAPLL